LFTNSCEEEQTSFGVDLLPDEDKVNSDFVQDIEVKAQTDTIGPVQTHDNLFMQWGVLNDPVFGQTKAEFVTEYNFSRSDSLPVYDPVVDSVKLFFATEGFYGDENSLNRMKIYALTDSLETDSSGALNSLNYSFNYNSTPLFDELVEYKKRYALHISKSYGEKFFMSENFSYNDSSRKSMNHFRMDFPGLYFQAENASSTGAIMNFRFIPKENELNFPRIITYYHDPGADSIETDSLIFYFADIRKQNLYQHPDEENLYSQWQSISDSVLYIKGLAGNQVNLSFPTLNELITEQNISAFNKVELKVFLEDFDKTSEIFYPPGFLTLKYVDENEELQSVFDQTMPGFSIYFNGKYNTVDKSYSFNLTRHFNAILKGEVENGDFVMYCGENETYDMLYSSFTRVALAGTGNSKKIQLKAIFSN
jgi:hypothetical protein